MQITDEMVDAACDAWYYGEDWRAVIGMMGRNAFAEWARAEMRRALEAAVKIAEAT